jgi:hypothetical protein
MENKAVEGTFTVPVQQAHKRATDAMGVALGSVEKTRSSGKN